MIIHKFLVGALREVLPTEDSILMDIKMYLFAMQYYNYSKTVSLVEEFYLFHWPLFYNNI